MNIKNSSGEVTGMDRRIEGTFREYGNLVRSIEKLQSEGYEASQLLVITRNNLEAGLTEKTGVKVVITKGESLWNKIVSFFTVVLDDEEALEEEIFEDYGIDEELYDRFVQALEEGEYLLLLDTAPPADVNHHANFMVRDGIIKEEVVQKTVDPDWMDSDNSVGDLPAHSLAASRQVELEEKDESAHSDTDVVLDDIQYDEVDYPDVDKVSKDPYGGETRNQ